MVSFALYADCESADLDVVETAVIDGIVAATRLASGDVLDVQVACGSIKVDVTLKNEAFAAQVESAIATKKMTVEVNGANVAPVLMADTSSTITTTAAAATTATATATATTTTTTTATATTTTPVEEVGTTANATATAAGEVGQMVIVDQVLAQLKASKADGGARTASAMLSAGFSAEALIYAGYTESELTIAGVTADEYATAAMSASLYREENLSDDVGGSTGTAAGGKSNGGLATIVVPVVLVSLIMFIVANIVFRRKSLNADDGGMNENGRPQRYENPAYDASSPGDANGNLQFAVASGVGAAAGAAKAESKPKKRGSFRMAKKDKAGLTDGPEGPPEWADPEVPFLSRDEAEKKLEANGMVNASFVVRQSKSVVRGYVVTSCFDGNVANSQLKYKAGELFYGARKVGTSLESALAALQTTTKVTSIGGIEAYLLVDRISLPAPPKPAVVPAASEAAAAGTAEKKKKKKKKKKKATTGSAVAVPTDSGEKKKSSTKVEETQLVVNPTAKIAWTEGGDGSVGDGLDALDLDTGAISDSGSLDLDDDTFFGKMVTAADTDGDGMVSLEEATAMGMDKATFNAMDADGNGQLTKAEVETWSMQNKGEAASMLNMLNEDGDYESDGSDISL